jgi:hypothetical protein
MTLLLGVVLDIEAEEAAAAAAEELSYSRVATPRASCPRVALCRRIAHGSAEHRWITRFRIRW